MPYISLEKGGGRGAKAHGGTEEWWGGKAYGDIGLKGVRGGGGVLNESICIMFQID